MQGILEKHDRKRFDVHVFDNRTNNSDSTAQHLKSLKLNWHDISELSTEEAIKSIIENSIDILIDLSGHTNGGRPDIFSHKVAPLKSQDIRDYVLSIFTHAGVSKDRIILKYYSPTKKQHWEDLSQFDIALDSYPYNGTTTTCDLLNLGIPVVSRSGQSHVSRTTGSILNTLNLQSWISENEKDFVNTCQEKASNYSELVKLRQSLSKLVQSTTLGNSNLFMAAYEELLITTWENK